MTSRRLHRPALAGGGLFMLLALVALAASGRGPGGDSDADRSLSGGWIDIVFTLALVGMVLTIVALVASMRIRREDDSGLDLRFMLLAGAIAAGLFFAIAYGVTLLDDGKRQAPQPTGTVGRGGGGGDSPQTVPVTQSGRDVGLSTPTLVLVVLGLVALLAATVGRSRWRRRRARLREREAVEAVRAVLQEALDDLEGGDPREAVIAAYARMERTLALHGMPRRAPEAPLEYTARVLTELHASAASVSALADLFERARFSTHEIHDDDRDDAVRALRAVRDELGEAA